MDLAGRVKDRAVRYWERLATAQSGQTSSLLLAQTQSLGSRCPQFSLKLDQLLDQFRVVLRLHHYAHDSRRGLPSIALRAEFYRPSPESALRCNAVTI